MPHHMRTAAALPLTILALAGCGATHPRPARSGHRAGAEPAVAPTPTRRPAGRQVAVGTHPEGIVADPALGLVAVATRDPSEITVLSARSGRVLRRIPIGGAVRHLGLEGTTVLVPDAPENRLLRVDPRTGAVAATPVGREPHDAAATDGRIFVADEFGRSVSAIDAAGAVTAIGGFTQPGGVAASGDDVAVVDVGADTLTLIDARTLRRLATVAAGAGPTHVVDDDGDLFVADTRGNALLEFATPPPAPAPGVVRAPLTRTARLPLPGTPYGIAVDPVRGHVWVTLTGTDTLVEVSANPQHPRVLARFPTARQPNTVAVDSRTGEVYVADAGAGTVQLIDPR